MGPCCQRRMVGRVRREIAGGPSWSTCRRLGWGTGADRSAGGGAGAGRLAPQLGDVSTGLEENESNPGPEPGPGGPELCDSEKLALLSGSPAAPQRHSKVTRLGSAQQQDRAGATEPSPACLSARADQERQRQRKTGPCISYAHKCRMSQEERRPARRIQIFFVTLHPQRHQGTQSSSVSALCRALELSPSKTPSATQLA